MPNIDRFKGIKINVYNSKYLLPHIHTVHNEYEVLIEIENGNIYEGDLPINQKRQTMTQIRDNAEWTLKVFYELNQKLK
ncbi:MAG: hypothetical protein DRP93_04785 [Candidatus Neomarinimicrobiota bacterium]|nr:MAG: hypothetical protein DRP93_04785 [Candidatus Neomarinimicrobiota bacterium]